MSTPASPEWRRADRAAVRSLAAGLLLPALLLSGLQWAGPARAQGDAPLAPAQERERIGRERRAIEARFDAARRDCETRFVVTSCLDQARAERRAGLDRLAREQAVLDDAQRRQRAAERLQAIEDKRRAADDARPPSAVQRLPRPTPGPAATAATAASAARATPAPASATGSSAAEQARHRADYERRQQQADAHREAVRQRDAERSAQKPPAAPLPVPAASAPR